jgi:molecular chaperone GrpE
MNTDENESIMNENTEEAALEEETEITEPETEDAPADFEKKYNDMLDKYQRSLAEFDNFRKRTVKEKASLYDDGLRAVVEKLLPVADNFERALKTVENKEDAFYQGIVMIAKQLDGLLSGLNVEAIPSVGESFNHNVHFAVAHVEDTNYGSNMVIEEMQKGYKHKDRVIRPSMVKVAN